MEAAFVLARCFPISCSRGAAYTGLHRLAVATQASCFGGLLYGSLQFHFFSFRYFVALCIIFLDFFLTDIFFICSWINSYLFLATFHLF